MRRRTVVVPFVLALALPAVALAEKLPPHTSFYAEDQNYQGKGTNIQFSINRASHRATIYAYDNCIGPQQGGYTPDATVRGAAVRGSKLSYDGNATVYTQTGSTTIKLKLSAKVTKRKVTGSVSFPSTSGCSKRSFVAKLTSSTK